MRVAASLLLSGALAAVALQAQGSGPPKGMALARAGVYAPAGPRGGTEFDAAEVIGQGPGALLFVRQISGKVTPLIRVLDELAEEFGILGFRAFAIRVAADRAAAIRSAERVSARLRLTSPVVVSTDGAGGPPGYALDPAFPLTLVVCKDGVVHRTLAMRSPDAADGPRLRRFVTEVAGRLPSGDALRTLIEGQPDDPAVLRRWVVQFSLELRRLRKSRVAFRNKQQFGARHVGPQGRAKRPATPTARGNPRSGPEPGTPLAPVPVHVVTADGPGRELDAAAAIGEQPGLLLFLHEITGNVAGLLRVLDDLARERDLTGFRAFAVRLDDDRDRAQRWAVATTEALRLTNPIVVSADGMAGPAGYGLNADCAMTLVLCKGGVVHQSIPFSHADRRRSSALGGYIEEIAGPAPGDSELRGLIAQQLSADPAELKQRMLDLLGELRVLRRQRDRDRHASRMIAANQKARAAAERTRPRGPASAAVLPERVHHTPRDAGLQELVNELKGAADAGLARRLLAALAGRVEAEPALRRDAVLTLRSLSRSGVAEAVGKQIMASAGRFAAVDFAASCASELQFLDVSRQVGVGRGTGYFKETFGPLWTDLNGDGWVDLVYMNHEAMPSLYVNQQGERFVNRFAQSGIRGPGQWVYSQQWDRHAGSSVDYDNDGDLDLFFTHGAQLGQMLGVKYDELLVNRGDLEFGEITHEAGTLNAQGRARCATWVDHDNDGWLDLYIGNLQSRNVLYRNRGDGTFSDVTRTAKLGLLPQHTQGWFDVDNDGRIDLLALAPPVLMRNTGDGTFVNISREAKLSHLGASVSTAAMGDFDGDGDTDLFLGSRLIGQSGVFRNDAGVFVPVSGSFGPEAGGETTGAAWGDVDNDGDLDLITVGTRRLRLFENDGGKFSQSSADASFGLCLGRGADVALADYDNDGYLDLAVNGINRHHVFENQREGNAWLKVTFRGKRSNRSGFGAKVWASVDSVQIAFREYMGDTASTRSAGAAPLHLGLGKAAAVSLRVVWPSGVEQRLAGIEPNQTIEVVEP